VQQSSKYQLAICHFCPIIYDGCLKCLPAPTGPIKISLCLTIGQPNLNCYLHYCKHTTRNP